MRSPAFRRGVLVGAALMGAAVLTSVLHLVGVVAALWSAEDLDQGD